MVLQPFWIGLLSFNNFIRFRNVIDAVYFLNNNSQYIVLIVFGLISIALGSADFRSYFKKLVTGKERISKTLNVNMMGTIAVITAVLVVNPPLNQNGFVIFLTILITPIVFWWELSNSKMILI